MKAMILAVLAALSLTACSAEIISGLDTGQYSTAAEAKRACGSDQVVWENPNTGVLHPLTDKYYAKVNGSPYMCKTAALKDGMYYVAR